MMEGARRGMGKEKWRGDAEKRGRRRTMAQERTRGGARGLADEAAQNERMAASRRASRWPEAEGTAKKREPWCGKQARDGGAGRCGDFGGCVCAGGAGAPTAGKKPARPAEVPAPLRSAREKNARRKTARRDARVDESVERRGAEGADETG